jgi:hypothetical protein
VLAALVNVVRWPATLYPYVAESSVVPVLVNKNAPRHTASNQIRMTRQAMFWKS